jgi:hypothetical protein
MTRTVLLLPAAAGFGAAAAAGVGRAGSPVPGAVGIAGGCWPGGLPVTGRLPPPLPSSQSLSSSEGLRLMLTQPLAALPPPPLPLPLLPGTSRRGLPAASPLGAIAAAAEPAPAAVPSDPGAGSAPAGSPMPGLGVPQGGRVGGPGAVRGSC